MQEKEVIEYDLSTFEEGDWVSFKNVLRSYNIRYWVKGNTLMTEDIERFKTALHYWMYGEEE